MTGCTLGWFRTSVIAVAMLLSLRGAARAYEIGSGMYDSSAVTAIARGTKQVGVAAIFVADYASAGEVTTFRATVLGELSFRYFVHRNVAIGIDLDPYYKHDSSNALGTTATASEVGGLVLVDAHYYARLGGGFFLRPGGGLGAFLGSHRTPLTDFAVTTTTVYGGAAQVDLGLVFFPSSRVSLEAVPRVLVFAGRSDAGTVVNADAGFSVGVHYTF